MTNKEKCNLLENTIYQLYTLEGRSKSYISRILEIDRKVLTNFIKEKNFPENKTKTHLTPSEQKILNMHKNYLLSEFEKNTPLIEISQHINVQRKTLYGVIEKDEELKAAYNLKREKEKKAHTERIEKLKENSSFQYDFEEIEGEKWKEILGYEQYFISTKGRIKKYNERYHSYYLIKSFKNPKSGRFYVSLTNTDGKRKSLQVSRLVGMAFLSEFHTDEKNTINHLDGNIENNCVENLEWCSQSKNNYHAYRELGRNVVRGKRYVFDKILYQNKYEFNTVAAFARFLGKSETQTRRYMDEPEKYNIKFICHDNNCND